MHTRWQDFTPLSPDFGYYADPRLATFAYELEPRGGISAGGTVVTVRGAGFDVLPDAGTAFVRCRWGSIYAEGNDTVALLVNATVLVCPSSPLDEGLQNLSIALNGQNFIATNLQLLVFPQPNAFSQVALNTTELGLGPAKFYGTLVGAPLGLVAQVWLRGIGFLAFQNSSTPLHERQLRCRWGAAASAATTAPLRACSRRTTLPPHALPKTDTHRTTYPVWQVWMTTSSCAPPLRVRVWARRACTSR
jgi:hypothetical protein